VAQPEEGGEGGVGQLGQFGRVVPNARWAGKAVCAGWKLGRGERKEKEKGAYDGLGQIDSRAGIEDERIWVAVFDFLNFGSKFEFKSNTFKNIQTKF
jgi:hypothetical protein